MKKLLLITCALFIYSASFAQRSADAVLVLSTPDDGDNFDASGEFPYKTYLTNNGPDDMKQTDSVLTYFYFDNKATPDSVAFMGKGGPCLTGWVAGGLPSGSTAMFSFNISFVKPPAPGPHNLCIEVVLQNRSADSVKDKLTTNNRKCVDIVIDVPTSISKTHASADVKVYPNPASDNVTFDVNTTAAKTELLITDVMGRVVYTQIKDKAAQGIQTIQVATNLFQEGIYLYHINAGSMVYTGKFFITH